MIIHPDHAEPALPPAEQRRGWRPPCRCQWHPTAPARARRRHDRCAAGRAPGAALVRSRFEIGDDHRQFMREPTRWTAAAAGLTLVAESAFLATAIALARRCRIAWWYGLLAPLAAVLGAAIAVNGILLRTRRRVAWKGRIYAFSPEDETAMATPNNHFLLGRSSRTQPAPNPPARGVSMTKTSQRTSGIDNTTTRTGDRSKPLH